MRGEALRRGVLGRFAGVLVIGLGPMAVALIVVGVAERNPAWWVPGGVFVVAVLMSLSWTVRVRGDELVAGPPGMVLRRWRLADVLDVRLAALPVRGGPTCVELVTDRWTAKLWSSFGIFDRRRSEWVSLIVEAAGLGDAGEDRRRVTKDAYAAFFTAVYFSPALAAVGVTTVLAGNPVFGLLVVGAGLGTAARNIALFRGRRQRERTEQAGRRRRGLRRSS